MNNVISWDPEVASTWNFDQHVPLTKEVPFIIFDDVTSHVAQSVMSPIVIILQEVTLV